jgi:cytochrome c biogenesis protein CcmG/thiol:disulfide interchange protein DsbE
MTLPVRLVITIVLIGFLGGCGGGDGPSAKPTFGGGSQPPGASAKELAHLKNVAAIDDCPATGPAEGEASTASDLPNLVLTCLGGGRSVRLSGLGSKPIVINLWASWCEPCRKELPLLARAHRELGDRVQFLGIDVKDTAPEAAIRLADLSGVTYAQVSDRKFAVRGPMRISGIPQTIFVDAQGTMVHTERQPFRSYADVTAAIRQHLGVRP